MLICAHGAQMTNFPHGQEHQHHGQRAAAGGQFVFWWMVRRAGIRHEGSWWDPATSSAAKKTQQIEMDKPYFSQFAAEVFNATKERNMSIAIEVSAKAQGQAGTCQCS